MIEEIEVYLGEKQLKPDEMKNFICVNEYISEIVNEVYYQYYPERKPLK